MNNSIVKALFLIILSFALIHGNAQNKYFFGGNLGARIGSYTYIDISPVIGYNISQKASIGIGSKYQYYSATSTNIKTNIFGGNIFSTYTLVDDLYKYFSFLTYSSLVAHIEYEVLNLEKNDFYYPTYPLNGRFYLHGILVGGGIKQYISNRFAMAIMILWNLEDSNRLPYQNPQIRFGFYF